MISLYNQMLYDQMLYKFFEFLSNFAIRNLVQNVTGKLDLLLRVY